MLVGATSPNEGTAVVNCFSSQRQRRLDRMCIRRRITTNHRLVLQRQQRNRQIQVRDQFRRAAVDDERTPEQLEFRRQQNREQHRRTRDGMTPEQLEYGQQQNRDRHRQAHATLTPEQLEVQQQQDRDRHRQAHATLTPEQLEVQQQRDRDRHRQAYASLTPEQLDFRQQQDRDRHCQAYADLPPEQLEVRQQQNRDGYRRATAAEAVRITQEVNDSDETFSINMFGRPNAIQLENFESDQDKALLMFYENSHDHVGDLIQNLDDASPGDETNRAKDILLNTLENMKITPITQRVIQRRFNSLHDRNGIVIGCCCCGCTTILPTVSESGIALPPPILSVFPTDPKFNPLKFTPDELTEFNDQHHLMQQVRSSMAVNNGLERYHVHQQLLNIIIPPTVGGISTESTPVDDETNDGMEDDSDSRINIITESPDDIEDDSESNEDMEDTEEPGLEGYICPQCDAQLSMGNIPTYSVAKLDYGLLSRLNELPPGVSGPVNVPLPELLPIERLLIARHRPLAVTLKLAPGGTGPDGFIGHLITFVHRGPETLISSLPHVDNDFIDRIQVQFIGRRGLPEDTNTFLRHVPEARVRPDVVIRYLKILKVINPHYADITINDGAECLEDMIQIPARIFAERQLIDDPGLVELDQIAVGNPAESVHQGLQDVQLGESMNDDLNCDTHIEPVSMDSVFFNPRNGDASIAIISGPQLSEAERVINAISNIGEELQGESTDEQGGEELLPPTAAPLGRVRLQVPRNQDPLNEFTSNDVLFYAAFPVTFPLGRGLRKPGSVPKNDAMHMLSQHSRTVVSEPMVIFTLFNQDQRHSVVRALAAKVRASPASFHMFSTIVNAPNFQSRCDEAARNSNGSVAQQLLREILPLVRVSGANVKFGPVERARAACDLYANCRRFGLPTFFFTLAPDYRDPLTLRLGISKPIFEGFPYEDGGYRDSLHAWDIAGRPSNEVFTATYRITPETPPVVTGHYPITTSHLQDIVRKNATAQSIVYMSLLNAVFDGLLGTPMDQHVKKTVPLSSRPIGIFGRTRAASLSTECQGRGTLHGHCLVWVELTPQVLQRLAGRAIFSEQISRILDTMIISSLDLPDHITSVLSDKRPHVNVWKNHCDPIEEPDDCRKNITANMIATQIHKHSDTCKKGSHGSDHCRLAFKRVPSPDTFPIELKLVEHTSGTVPHTVEDSTDISEWKREEPDWNVAALPAIDPRIVYWATKRPLFHYSGIFNEHGELKSELSSSLIGVTPDLTVVDKIGRLSDNEKRQFVEELIKRNCYVVETSPTAALLLCCNTNAQVLGATEQAKGVVQYLVHYITKHSSPLAQVASLVAAARRHTITYPSRAEDGDTPSRMTKYLVTRVLNNISGMSEVSTSQAAGSLMGLSPMSSTQFTQYCFIKGAINFQKSLPHNDSHIAVDYIDSDSDDYDGEEQSLDNYSDNDNVHDDDDYDGDDAFSMNRAISTRHSIENNIHGIGNSREEVNHCDQNQVNTNENEVCNNGLGLLGWSTAISDLVINGTLPEATEAGMPSISEHHEREGDEFAIVYTIDGVHTPITPYTHYLHRGNQLRFMSFIEYSSIVKIVKRSQQVEDGNTVRRGRQSNKAFLFNERHPLFRTYRQQLRSKQATPILAGYPPPPYPGNVPDQSTRISRNEWKLFATYYLTAFCPWNVETGTIPYTFNFGGYSEFVRTMATRHTFLDRARMFFMESTIRVLRIKQKNLIAITHYRFSNADRRIGNRFEGQCNNNSNSNDLNNDNGQENQDLVHQLELIRAEARQDDNSELNASAGEQNAIHVRDALRSVMGDNVINDDTDHMTGQHVSITSQENPVFSMTNSQALEVLNSIRLAPSTLPQEQPSIQQVRVVDGLTVPITTADEEVLHTPPEDLNEKQLDAYLRCSEYLQFQSRLNQGQNVSVDVSTPHILIHGAPGTGKSFIVEKVVQRAKDLGIGTLSCAFTGAAATNLLNGMTILSMFGIPMVSPSRNNDIPPLSPAKLVSIRNLFRCGQSDQVKMLFIDEISLVTPILFSMMNKRLMQIFDNSTPFGGISVILLGDFQQLDPVSSKSMCDAVVEHLVHNRRSNMYTIGSPREDGINLFISFVLLALTQQQRASEDINHTELLERVRDINTQFPITSEIIYRFSTMVLTAQNVLDEPEWRYAPVAVCGNIERAELNHDQAKRFANDHGHQVIQWRPDLAGAAASFPTDVTNYIYDKKTSQLTFTFVKNAPAFINENINALKGVVNGSPCTLHSLTWTGEATSMEMQNLIRNATRGAIVTLPIPPDFVNVRLEGVPHCQSDSLLGVNDYVIPIPLARKNNVVKLSSQNIEAKFHALELGFAVTFYKLQGKTIPRLIINPYKRGCTPEIDLMSLLVGLSRVRNSSRVRFLPVQSNSTASPFLHLTRLKSNNDFRIWWAGFNENGQWNQALSLQASFINRQQSPRRRRVTTTPNTEPQQSRSRNIPPRRVSETTAQTTACNQQNIRLLNEVSPPLTITNVAATASPFFVPFLCAIKGFPHPQIETVKDYMTLEIWDIMIRRTQYVHQYVQENGTNNDQTFINNWPWEIRPNNAPMYIDAPSQERLLGFEEQYNDAFNLPTNCIHESIIPGATCGQLLMQNFNDWNAAQNL